MPPIHPAIVHFPIALLVLSVIADFFGYIYQSDSLKGTGWWSLVGAAIGGVFAVAAGYYDMKREEEKLEHEAHEQVHKHMKVGFALLAAIAGLTVWRWLIYANQDYSLNWFYLIAAVLIVALAFFQGWLGGELVFGYGVGVAPTGQGTEPEREAKNRVEKVVGEGEEDKDSH
ncbi:MAG: DUF2231 domain-containing protein [Aridibacter sp.]